MRRKVFNEKVFLAYGGKATPAKMRMGDLDVYLARKLTWFERRFGLRVAYTEFIVKAATEQGDKLAG